MKQRVAIVDYGMCNLDSVRRATEECGADPFVTDDPADLRSADRIVLPGVGAFPDAMHALQDRKLDIALTEEVIGRGIPFLGVCLGMQLIAEHGEEGGDTPGLGWFPGRVIKLVPTEVDRRVPHIGWNELVPSQESVLFNGVPDRADFYFVHSYWLDCPADLVVATTPYCGSVTAVVQRDNIYGVQFHPEKSQRHGFQLFRNFLAA